MGDRGFFDFFATPVPEAEQQALAVAEASVEAGEPPQLARRYARLIQAYELDFWNTLATDGMRILHDPQGLFEALERACRPSR